MADAEDGRVLIVETQGAVRILRMNRPGKLNALNGALTQALHDALLAADAEDSIRAVVLCGAGRSFCAGADLSEFSELTPDNPQKVLHRANLTMRTQMLMQTLGKPVVSAVQGAAVGGGAGLALAADMMVVGDDLRFGYPEMRHNIVPAIVMTGLQRQIGRKRAFELVSLGRLIDAAEAQAIGLANRLVAPAAVVETALGIAMRWAATNPMAMAASKSLFYRVSDLPYEAAMAAGRDVNIMMRGFRSAGASP